MRKTKIVCTIGPACQDRETLKEMMLAGMNVARLNFSHGTHASHCETIQILKELRAELDLPVAIMLDTKGPEYRVGVFEDGKVELAPGDEFRLYAETQIQGVQTEGLKAAETGSAEDAKPLFRAPVRLGNQDGVPVNYPLLAQELQPGDTILLNDGLMEFTVKALEGPDLVCTVVTGGVLSDHKSMSFPGKVFKRDYLSDADRSDILFGIQQDVDLVAASFVSNKEDIQALRGFMNANGGENIDIIAKIENQSGVDKLEEIADACEGIMVARGDMGVELPYVKIPAIQKRMIALCRAKGKPVITATEMLESMTENIRPTRAEISDVANAVYDGSSAVMLSGETASGKFPLEALRTMAGIAEETEQNIDYAAGSFRAFGANGFRASGLKAPGSPVSRMSGTSYDAFSNAACSLAIDSGAALIAVNTLSGATARMIARCRPPMPVLALTPAAKESCKLAVCWGVIPVQTQALTTLEARMTAAADTARRLGLAAPGSSIVITSGEAPFRTGGSNTLRVETI